MSDTVNSELTRLCSSELGLKTHISEKLKNYHPKTHVFTKEKTTPAAVLIPIFFKNGEAHLLFTKRTEIVEHHKGQISFPGGKREKADKNLRITALRETEEEVGIKQQDVTILGQIDRLVTNTLYRVSSFVGYFDYPYAYSINEDEIDHLIEVPLVHLLDPTMFELKPYTAFGREWMVHYYSYESEIIWGVTGFLLSNFISLLFDEQRKPLLF